MKANAGYTQRIVFVGPYDTKNPHMRREQVRDAIAFFQTQYPDRKFHGRPRSNERFEINYDMKPEDY